MTGRGPLNLIKPLTGISLAASLCCCHLILSYGPPASGTDGPAADAARETRDTGGAAAHDGGSPQKDGPGSDGPPPEDTAPQADSARDSAAGDTTPPDLVTADSVAPPLQVTAPSFVQCTSELAVGVLVIEVENDGGEPLLFSWSASAGELRSKDKKANLVPPAAEVPCPITIEVEVTAQTSGRSAAATFEVYFTWAGDFDQDGDVEDDDLLVIETEFGRTDCCDAAPGCQADVDGDCDVDGSDLATFSAQYPSSGGCACP